MKDIMTIALSQRYDEKFVCHISGKTAKLKAGFGDTLAAAINDAMTNVPPVLKFLAVDPEDWGK